MGSTIEREVNGTELNWKTHFI